MERERGWSFCSPLEGKALGGCVRCVSESGKERKVSHRKGSVSMGWEKVGSIRLHNALLLPD